MLTAVGAREFHETGAGGDEDRLANRALDGGATTIVVVGGDGTCACTANAIVRRGSNCRLAVIPTGTGNDFAKTLGLLPLTHAEIVQLIAGGSASRIDVGRVDDRFFLNSCGFGFDASVLEASNDVRMLKGNAVYIYSALTQLFTYRGIDVAPNEAQKKKRLLMLTVSNGCYLGGAFRIAPGASVADGKLDVGYFADSNVVQRLRLFAGAMRGTHFSLASARSEQTDRLILDFAAPPTMEVDGELRRAQSSRVNIQCVPGALSVIAAPGFPR